MTTLENTFNTVSFMDQNTGEIFPVPSTRYRTIVDLKGFDDREVNSSPSLTDVDGFIPLKEQIERFFPEGVSFDGFEDEEDFDSDDLIDDKLDYVDYIADKLEKQSVESFSDNKATQPVIDEKNVSVSEKSTGAEASE